MEYKTAWNPSVTSGGAGGSNIVADPSSSPVRDRLGNSEQWLSELHASVDELEKRLDTILTPVPPQAAAQTGPAPTPQQVQSHMQGRLGILNEGFSHLNARLNQLLRRIEL